MRQVLHNTDKDILLNVPLNNEQEVRRQWGTPSGTVVFKYGYVSFTTDGKIELSQPIYGIKSIRLIVDIDTTTEDVIKLSSTHSVSIAAGTITATGFSSPTIYVDGVATSTVTAGKAEITITTATSFTADDIILGYISSYLEGKIYAVQLYNIVLDSSSVINLGNDARYAMPKLEHREQLGISEIANGDMSLDDDDDGYANDWENAIWGQTQIASIVDDAQRITIGSTDSSYKFNIKTPVTYIDGVLYKITCKFRSGTNAKVFMRTGLSGSDLFYESETLNTPDWYDIEAYYLGGTNASEITLYLYSTLTVIGHWWEYKDITVNAVSINETKKILHVTAKDGVCRNMLSGSVTPNVIPEASSQMTSQSGIDWWGSGSGSHLWDGDSSLILTGTGLTPFIWKGDTMWGINKKFRITLRCKSSTYTDYLKVYIGSWLLDKYVTGNISSEWQDFVIENVDYNGSGALYIQAAQALNGDIEFDYIIAEEVIPEVVNTDIEVVKDSPGYVPRFDGLTSEIDCGNYNDLLGDITVLVWANLNGDCDQAYPRFIDNGNFQFMIRWTNAYLMAGNDASTFVFAPDNTFNYDEWVLASMTRTASGLIQFYVNGEAVGGADQDGGTPIVGSNNILIGTNLTSTRVWDGEQNETIVLSGLLTPAEISQYFSATKHKYQK